MVDKIYFQKPFTIRTTKISICCCLRRNILKNIKTTKNTNTVSQWFTAASCVKIWLKSDLNWLRKYTFKNRLLLEPRKYLKIMNTNCIFQVMKVSWRWCPALFFFKLKITLRGLLLYAFHAIFKKLLSLNARLKLLLNECLHLHTLRKFSWTLIWSGWENKLTLVFFSLRKTTLLLLPQSSPYEILIRIASEVWNLLNKTIKPS